MGFSPRSRNSADRQMKAGEGTCWSRGKELVG